jgi:hypothetical protein
MKNRVLVDLSGTVTILHLFKPAKPDTADKKPLRVDDEVSFVVKTEKREGKRIRKAVSVELVPPKTVPTEPLGMS